MALPQAYFGASLWHQPKSHVWKSRDTKFRTAWTIESTNVPVPDKVTNAPQMRVNLRFQRRSKRRWGVETKSEGLAWAYIGVGYAYIRSGYIYDPG